MALITANNLVKSYKGEVLFDDVSLQIQTGEKLGLIGANGTGKTTLLEILYGQKEADRGELERARSATYGYLPQTLTWTEEGMVGEYLWQAFSHQLQLRETLERLEEEISNNPQDTERLQAYAHIQEQYEEAGGYSCESRIRGIVHGLGFGDEALNRSLKDFSGGEKTRLALARLLLEEPDLLFLDEPTNHLDLENREWLAGFLREYRGALLLISHDRYFLDQVVESILEMEDKKLYAYPGTYSNYKEQRDILVRTWSRRYEKQQEEIAALEDFVRRYKAGQRSREARAREKRLQRMERIPPPPTPKRQLRHTFSQNRPSGIEVLEVQGMTCVKGGKTLFRNVDVTLRRGERVALLGPNGAGKTTFLKALLHRETSAEGSVYWGHHVKVGYFDQEGGDLPQDQTLFQVLAGAGLHLKQDIMDYLGSFRFSGDEVEKKVRELSGGERARLNLALLLREQNNVLILDEPTNHLDVMLQEWLEWALKRFQGTVLFTSHDRYFIESLASTFWKVEKGRFVWYRGSFQEFQEKERQRLKKMEAQKQTRRPVKLKPQIDREQQKLEQNRLDLEKRLEEVEEELSALERQFEDPEIFKTSAGEELSRQYREMEARRDRLYEAWEATLE